MAELNCHICFELGGRRIDFSKYLSSVSKAHAETHRLQIGDESSGAADGFFLLCFPTFANRNFSEDRSIKNEIGGISIDDSYEQPNDESGAKISTELAFRSLWDRCHSVAEEFPKHKIFCSFCGLQLNGADEKLDITRCLFDHASRHLRNPLFKCRFCDHQSITEPLIKKHQEDFHSVTSTIFLHAGFYYDEKIADCNDILAFANSCFTAKVADLGFAMIRLASPPERSKNFSFATRCCAKLVKKFANGGIVQCQICSTSLKAKPYTGMMNHATARHLKKALFSCGFCKKQITSSNNLSQHMSVHGGCVSGSYIDHRKKYQLDIVRVLFECFASKKMAGSKGSVQNPKVHVWSKAVAASKKVKKEAADVEEKETIEGNESIEVIWTSQEDTSELSNYYKCDRCSFRTVHLDVMEIHSGLLHA